jgi:hypothetical protein
MRTFCFLSVLAVAASAFAQDQPKSYGQFYGPLATGDWAAKLRRTYAAKPPETFVLGAPVQALSSTCSVPLLEAQIPQDVQFTMMYAAPQTGIAPIPQALPPAPPCPPSH